MTDNLTPAQRILSSKYIAYSFITGLCFHSAVWLHFYRIFMSDQKKGLLDILTFSIGLLAEIPSGVIADAFGRAKICRFGHVLNAIGLIILASSTSSLHYQIGITIHVIGMALVSGADQALFFDKLAFHPESLSWRRLATRGYQAGLIAAVMSAIIGGLFYTVNPRIPFSVDAIAFFSAYLLLRPIQDPPSLPRPNAVLVEIKQHISEIFRGFAAFLSPTLRLYIPIIVVVQGLFYAADWGTFRVILLDRFHFDPFQGSIVIATVILLTVAVLHLMHRFADALPEQFVFIGVSVIAAIGLLLSIFDLGRWGWFVIFALYAGDLALRPVISESLNARVAPANRATMLSVASFLKNLTYVALSPILGFLNSANRLHYFLLVWPLLIGVAIITYLTSKRRCESCALID